MAGLLLISLRSAFEPILTSTFTTDIGLQFLITPQSLSFFSIRVIIASFCEVDNSS